MDELQEIVYDYDEYEYQKVGESDTEYEERFARIAKNVNARVSEEERQLAAKVLENAALTST